MAACPSAYTSHRSTYVADRRTTPTRQNMKAAVSACKTARFVGGHRAGSVVLFSHRRPPVGHLNLKARDG